MEVNDKMYSQIIFKAPDDPELQKMLSYKAKSSSPRRFKRWSPEISNEERTLKKKQREDEYIKKIYPDERPILLVKKKQKFENLNNPNLIGSIPSEDNKLKIMRQTELLVDVDEDIRKNSPQIKRQTVYHKGDGKQNQPLPGKQNIVKVDGIEYLPEGFLELDPLLMKDEYEFDNQLMENMFKDEQRRLKALRRKQYTEKNYQKKRDVTIYVIEDYKDRIIEFMDLWFEKYQRKMTPVELEEVSKRLDTSFENLNRLQELYLKRKRLLKSKEMKQMAKMNGRDWSQYEQTALTPNQIKEYYKKQNKYKHVESKVKKDPLGASKWKYNPFFIQKYNEKRNKSQPLKGAYSIKSLSRNQSPFTKSQKSLKIKEMKKNLMMAGDKEEKNSVNNSFYMLSKTNNDGDYTDKGSWHLKQKPGKYDQMVNDFNKLVSGEKIPNEKFWVNVNGKKRRSTKYCSNVCRKHCPHGAHDHEEDHEKQYKPVIYEKKPQPLNEVEMYNQMIESQIKSPKVIKKKNAFEDPMESNYYSDLGKYFDAEIGEILNKIKGYKVEGVTDCEVHLGNDHKLMNCTGSLEKNQEFENEKIENMVKPERNINVDELFHQKDINDLKNRVKSQTTGDPFKNALGERDNRQTFHNKYFENKMNLEPESEIDQLKRKTISLSPSPKQSMKSSTSKKNIENELLSNKVDGNRESGNSENFSFNPKIYNQNVKEQMNEVVKEFSEVPRISKKVTQSVVLDLEDEKKMKEEKNQEDSKRIETVNERHSSDFEDPNDNDLDSEIAKSRHQSEHELNKSSHQIDMRKKAGTMMHRDYEDNNRFLDLTKSRGESISSLTRSKNPSILSKGGKKRQTMKKRVTFCDLMSLPEEKEDDDFINKVPIGSIKLNRDQREKLIEVLENQEQEGDDDDIILTLNQDQVIDVVNKNVGGENVQVALDSNHLEILQNKVNPEKLRISIYPKHFFAMVEKNKLKGSRLSVYPEDFFDQFTESGRINRNTLKEGRQKAISVYPKDLFDMVEKALDNNEIDSYPQEIFDLLQEFGEYEITPNTRKKMKSVYPAEFLNLAEKQSERKRDRSKTVFPKELFELAEQEKVNNQRVSIYPKDLFQLMEKEARKRGKSFYPGDFFNMLDEEYCKVIDLSPEQIETVLKANTGDSNTQIVLSSDQRKTLLVNLKENQKREEEIMNEMNINKSDAQNFVMNEDILELPVLELEKDQVMDILNQNCLMDGAEISLTESQMNILEKPQTVRHTVIGTAYYDALVDELVDDTGNRITLSKMSIRDRKSVLSQLSHKNFSILVRGENDEEPPVLIENVYYNVEKDAIENPNTNEVIEIGLLDENQRSRELSRLSTINNKPSPTVLLGNAYYDALVDEIVDKNGERHSLKNMSLLEVKKLVDNQDCQRISIVVQPNENEALILENVTYLPVEDCLVDEKDHKTELADLNDEQRVILLQALSERRGSMLPDEAAFRKSKLNDKGGFVNFVEEVEIINDESEDSMDSNKYNVNIHRESVTKLNPKEEKDREDIRNRQKTGYPKKQIEENSSVNTEDYQLNVHKASVSRLDPNEDKQREDIRNRQKTGYPKKTGISKEEKEKLLTENENVRYRGSMGFKMKNYSGGFRKKANTIHPKGKKEKVKDIQDLEQSESQKSLKSDKASRKSKKVGPSRISNLRKKKKSTTSRRTITKNENEIVEEEYLKNVNNGQLANEQEIVTESIVVDNIVRGSKNSLINKLFGDDRELPSKRHTVSNKKSKDEDQRSKAKTFLGKDRFKKKSILTESEKSEDLNKSPEEELNVIEQIPKVQPEEAEFVKIESEEKLTESKKESLTHSQKIKKFEEMDKEQLPISKGGRRTFVAKRKKKSSKERTRGKTFANKYVSDDRIEEVNEEEFSNKDVQIPEYNHQSHPNNSNNFDNEIYKHFSHEPNNLKMVDSTKQISHHSPEKRKLKFTDEGNVSGVSDDLLKERIKEIFKQEKDKFSDDLFNQCRDYIDSRGSPRRRHNSDIMEEFYEFCKHKLPKDEKYKESIMYVSLFYYFMEKKKFLG